MQNRYESVYGPEVWNVAKGEVTLEENVKDTALARIMVLASSSLISGLMS